MFWWRRMGNEDFTGPADRWPSPMLITTGSCGMPRSCDVVPTAAIRSRNVLVGVGVCSHSVHLGVGNITGDFEISVGKRRKCNSNGSENKLDLASKVFRHRRTTLDRSEKKIMSLKFSEPTKVATYRNTTLISFLRHRMCRL
jgi:hypothetical protein